MYREFEEGKRESEYNELAHKMARLSSLQKTINETWNNPLGLWFNEKVIEDMGRYGFQIIYSCINQLYKEVKSKCKKEEIENTDKLRKEIEEILDKGTESICSKKIIFDKIEYNIDKQKWKELREKIQNFEEVVRVLLDEHGYNPDKDDLSGL